MSAYDAIVVGSGPNGLTAAATVAVAGKRVLVIEAADSVGGAARTVDHGTPGWSHDVGATIHALAAASPAFASLDLATHGVEFLDPPILLAHPLDGARGASLHRSVDMTAGGLGTDGQRYRRLLGPAREHFDDLAGDLLGPLLRVPRHPLLLAGFGARAVWPMSIVQRWFRTPEARALIGGSAAHSFTPLHHPLTTSFALMLHGAGHAHGWPVARGGTSAIVDALVEIIRRNGGDLVTGQEVRSRAELPTHDVLFLDTTPGAAVRIAGSGMTPRRRRSYRRYRHGPGAFKIDYELSGPIPWSYLPAREAGTVHVIGSYDELALAERQVHDGIMPDAPFVLVVQASVVDDSRAPTGSHTGWAYAHVPNGYTGDARPAIEAQIERFAPGFGGLVSAAHATAPSSLESMNANLVGGDIGGGSYSGLQIVARPRLSRHPYRTGSKDVYLCSASTPPGAGVHGMSGHHAALDALATSWTT